MTSFRALIALAMAVSVITLHSSAAKESGTPLIPLPPAPIVQNAKVQQDAGRREEPAADHADTCMEPEDERVCEMEMDLGEVTAFH